MTPEIINTFWREAGAERWFNGGAAFDHECDSRFRDAHHAAARREYEDWMASAEGALALLLLLDQIPRNIFRSSAHAYATDALARHYATRAVDTGLHLQVDGALRTFIYLPFEHSETIEDQRRSVALFRALGNELYLQYAQAHLDVIERFGRFPHRNHALARVSTPAEQAWLDAGGGF